MFFTRVKIARFIVIYRRKGGIFFKITLNLFPFFVSEIHYVYYIIFSHYKKLSMHILSAKKVDLSHINILSLSKYSL